MWQKIKDALNSSLLWVISALAAAFYFWNKMKMTQTKLEETKADATIKTDRAKVEQADIDGDSAIKRYNELRDRYKPTDVQ